MKNAVSLAFLIAIILIPEIIDAQMLPGYSAISGGSKRSGIRVQGLLGIDFAGRHVLEYNAESSTSIQLSPNLEIMYKKGDLAAGLGLGIHFNEFHGYPRPYTEYIFFPLYLSGRYSQDLNWLTTVEGLVNLGYGFFAPQFEYDSFSSSGGVYFGMGAGVVLNDKFVIQTMYKYNRAVLKVKVSDWSEYTENYDVENSGFNLSIGYRY